MNNIIHPKAKIGNNVQVGAFTSIHEDVIIGDNTEIHSNVVIYPGTRIGKNCTIFPGAVLGAVPQDLKFDGEYSTLEIGDNNTIREYVTLNRGTSATGKSSVGNNNTILAYSHLGHDSTIGNHTVISNNVQIAGHVVIEDYAIIGGSCGLHQFTRVGKYVMLGAMSGLGSNIPPYVMARNAPARFVGTNLLGLRRGNFDNDKIRLIGAVYKKLYSKKANFGDALKQIKTEFEIVDEVKAIVDFCEEYTSRDNTNKHQSRGIIKAEK